MNQPEPMVAGKEHASGITPLLEVLNHFHPVSPSIETYLTEHVVRSTVRKRRLLHSEGQHSEHIYFITKGAVRGFTREGQQDITTWINVENQLISPIFPGSGPARAIENIQALENCELLALSHDDLETLYERFPESNLIARKILQEYYANAERRAFIARLTKAENRYRHFLLLHPHLANRIPLKYIASYLGMTLETLSRVRKKFSGSFRPTSSPVSTPIRPNPTDGKYSS